LEKNVPDGLRKADDVETSSNYCDIDPIDHCLLQ
jgi:hypothetical protein